MSTSLLTNSDVRDILSFQALLVLYYSLRRTFLVSCSSQLACCVYCPTDGTHRLYISFPIFLGSLITGHSFGPWVMKKAIQHDGLHEYLH
jgi:hypothetical protein